MIYIKSTLVGIVTLFAVTIVYLASVPYVFLRMYPLPQQTVFLSHSAQEWSPDGVCLWHRVWSVYRVPDGGRDDGYQNVNVANDGIGAGSPLSRGLCSPTAKPV